MSTESSSFPTETSQALLAGESKMPPLPPGYHFFISFCEVVCTREQIDAIHGELVEIARGLIREYDLRTASGRFVNTRVHIQRTAPLIEEDLSFQENEHKVGNLQDAAEEAGRENRTRMTDPGASADAGAGQIKE